MPTFPYTSGQGAITQTFAQLRKGGQSKIDSSYLQRFNIAPANESYVLSVLRFLGIIDEKGTRSDDASGYLFADDGAFMSGLEAAVRRSYSQLFDEMSDALQANRDTLTHWFRAVDKTSALVGQRQAATFLTLAALSGHGELPSTRTNSQRPSTSTGTSNRRPKITSQNPGSKMEGSSSGTETPLGTSTKENESHGGSVGLSVRVEVNLPADGDASTYDAIFASIRKHLMS